MARFRLRSWQEQTLYDCRDYEIEAGTLEEAAGLLDELQERAQEISEPVDLPPQVRRIDGASREMRALDPCEIVDGERGIAEIDADGHKLRDVLPAAADPVGDLPVKVLAEFVADIDAVGVDAVRQDWPDWLVTCEKARAALIAAEKQW